MRWMHLLGGDAPVVVDVAAAAADRPDPRPRPVVIDGVVVRDVEPIEWPEVVELWRCCDLVRPWNDPVADIERSLRSGGSVLVGLVRGSLAGTVMVGDDGHRGWLNYVAVGAAHRRRGVGRALLAVAEQRLVAGGCPKVNVQIRGEHAGAGDFYEVLGYDLEDVLGMGKRLTPRAKIR